MFNKLKVKVAEEVKNSHQRLQQFTQSLTEKIDHAASEENFFTIGDDDGQTSSSNTESGFSNVPLTSYSSTPNSGHLRRSSNTSIASDISFLPHYESPTNLYHMQSDLDISASEVEDNASTTSQLGHLTKEQIYAAFQKAQLRYHKYRGRYTDVAKHYKDLERENTKIRSVLVDTQDKALRRMSELREQCSLEQKAKAHLENSLRVDLDEKQYVIDSLKTKVDLLQSNKNNEPDKPNTLVNLTGTATINHEQLNNNLEIVTKELKDSKTEIENLNSKMQEMKANSIIFSSKEADLKKIILELEEVNKQKNVELSEVLERERENNLIIAQTKMELHTEIQNRDLEIELLKNDIESLKSDLDAYETKLKPIGNSTKLENFQTQNSKLIDKVEELTQKCNNYESELLKMQQFRIENQNLISNLETNNKKLVEYENCIKEQDSLQNQLKQQKVDYENKISLLRDNAKQSLLTLESKIKSKLQDEFTVKEEALTSSYEDKLQQLTQIDNTRETQLKLIDKVAETETLEMKLQELEQTLKKEKERYAVLEANHLDLIAESSEIRGKLSEFQKKNSELQQNLIASKNESSALLNEIETIQNSNVALQNDVTKFRQNIDSLKETNTELQNENAQLHCNTNNDNLVAKLKAVIADLQSKVNTLQDVNIALTHQQSLLQNENTNLRSKLENANSNLLQLEATVPELSKQNSNFEHQLNQASQSSKEYQSKLVEKEKIILQQEKVIVDLKSELENLQIILEETHQNVKEIEKQKSVIQEKLKGEKVKYHGEMQTLNTEISKFKEHNNSIQVYIEECKQKLIQYEAHSEENRVQLESLTGENTSLTNEIIKLKNLLQASDTVNKNVIQQLNNALDENTQIKVSEELLNQHLEDKSSNFSDKIKQLTELHLKLKEKIIIQEKDQDSLSIQILHNADENRILKEQILQLEREGTAKCENYEDMKLQLIDYEGKCQSLSGEITVLNESIASYKNELLNYQNIQTNYQRLQNEKLEIHNKLAETQRRVDEVNTENKILVDQVSKLEEQENIQAEELTKIRDIKVESSRIIDEISELKRRNNELSSDYKQTTAENEEIVTELADTKLKLDTTLREKLKNEELVNKIESEKAELLIELKQYRNDLDKLKLSPVEMDSTQQIENLLNDNKSLKLQLGQLEDKCEVCEKHRKKLEGQLRELENQYTEISHEKQLLQDEIQELKISPINTFNVVQKLDNLDIIHTNTNSLETPNNMDNVANTHQNEIDDLNEKLIQYRSLDLTNRSSIQFYENELQKLRNKNEKLNRKLDETLVTLNHCAELSHTTETEYLKNILYNYMLGKESLVLARVIAAVCKFDDSQTNTILQKEQQRQSLVCI